jgi:hypothetical protein
VDQEISPVLKNRMQREIEDAAVVLALKRPAFGQVGVANELRNRGHTVWPAGVAGDNEQAAQGGRREAKSAYSWRLPLDIHRVASRNDCPCDICRARGA